MYKKLLLFSSLLLSTIFLQDSIVYAQEREQKQEGLPQQINQEQKEEVIGQLPIAPPVIELTAPIEDNTVSKLLHQLSLLRRVYASYSQSFKKVILIINSGGGDASAGLTAYEHLKNLPFTLHTHNIAEASSAAAAIYCAGDIRTASPSSFFTLHYPTMSGQTFYSENQSLTRHEWMKNHSRFLERATSDCTNLSQEQIKNTLQKETVYNVNEAREVDLVQEVNYPSEAMNNSCYHAVIYSQNNRAVSENNFCRIIREILANR